MTDTGALRFGEKMLALLEDGSFTATYKYAVLLGLLDLALENVGSRGEPPDSFTTAQLADRVIELYWAQAVPFGRGSEAEVLLQNAGRAGAQAAIVRDIQEFRGEMTRTHATASLVQLRQRAPRDFTRLSAEVEWKLIEMPLPRLQRIGSLHDPFLYDIAWDHTVLRAPVRAYQKGRPGTFDNRIQLRPGIGAYLIQFGALLRPLIHRKWAGMVARLNNLEEARLERFLFGGTRTSLEEVRQPLMEHQRGCCFYCSNRIRGRSEIDHFIPWSRYPEDGLANLVVAHEQCNRSKRDFLPATPHVERWSERLEAGDLVAIGRDLHWDAAIDEIRAVARGIYLRLPTDAVLWVSGADFAPPDLPRLRGVLA
jgi:5-methylcytosine-specific restriction endonuclease McrA